MSSTLGVPLDEDPPVLNVLYVGAHKRFKTTDIATMANLGTPNQRVAYIQFEAGLRAKALKSHGIQIDKIVKFSPRTPEELEEVYWSLAESMAKDPEQWIGTALDTVTEMQTLFLADAVKKRIAVEMKKAARTAENLLQKANWDEYNIWTAQAQDLIRKFRDLPCHTAFATHEVSEATAAGLKFLPKITASFRIDLLGYPDIIVQKVLAENPLTPHPDGIESLGICRNVDTFIGGDRLGITPVVLAHPTMERLWLLHEGLLNLDEDPYQQAYMARMGHQPMASKSEPRKEAPNESHEGTERNDV